jgi:hypothetical protein
MHFYDIDVNLISSTKCFFSIEFLLDGQALFRAFLRTEFSEENLEFWLACDDFRACKEPKRSGKAKKIYMDFIAIGAPKQVKLNF